VRILRLRLRHYRGVADREVELAPRGVTIVEGPNEVGKSSLAEAVLLLFDERDDTTKQRVREIQPVDRDEGSEVEADVELGPFVFTYTKRFHRRSGTSLAIRAPRVETLTGREAHERVQELLATHVDLVLWRALRWVQGAPLAQPALGDAPGLAEALDRAAGVGAGGEREESLFERARAAYEEHFTATGRPRRELLRSERARDEAAGEEQRARGELDALERDVEAEAALRRRVAELEQRVARGRIALRERDAELEALHALGEEVTRLAARLELARAEESLAVQTARQRGQLVSAQAGAVAEVESLAEALESEEPAVVAAGAELRHVEERLEAARAARAAAAEVVQCARRDATFRRDERALAELSERALRIAHEREEVARARRVLAAPEIDERQVAEIQRAQLATEHARARLAAEGPRVQLAPEVDLEVTVDGRRERLRAGEPVERRVAEALVLSLPGVADVTVVAGAGVAERRKALEQAETRLRTLCVEAGVDDHAGALAALAARRAAAEELARGEKRLAQALDRESSESLDRRLRELGARIERYRAERPAAPALPASVEEAERALEEAEESAARTREAAEDLARRREDAALRYSRWEHRRTDTRARLELAERTRADLGRRLAEARTEASDEQLEERREACGEVAREREQDWRAAAARLAEREPEALAARAARERDTVDSDERALREQRDALLRKVERLEVMGGAGLFERWQHALRRRERAERDHARLLRRAEAARRLFEVLREERDAARSHYAMPLASAIARLGRPLYGSDFDVELDDELRVARRILGGRSLLESQLSAGAREQLSLLTRIAAARIAGGVPLWLDDALGHSDPERLAALGPLLAAAGETSQVIVLTCSPERFRSVPDARVVALR